MKTNVKNPLSWLFVAAYLCATLGASVASASWYPPNYPICSARDAKTTGPFEVIRDTTRYDRNGVSLTIAYRGFLLSRFPANQINFYVRLNGNDILIPAQAGSYGDAYVYLRAGARDCSICQEYLRATWPACDAFLTAGNSPDWLCANPTADEAELFTWAFNGSQTNAWDIEVAAESHGQWDSNYGRNFKTRLDPRSGCF